jgi:hypothetical protein
VEPGDFKLMIYDGNNKMLQSKDFKIN